MTAYANREGEAENVRKIIEYFRYDVREVLQLCERFSLVHGMDASSMCLSIWKSDQDQNLAAVPIWCTPIRFISVTKGAER